jgi:hypothetical protein
MEIYSAIRSKKLFVGVVVFSRREKEKPRVVGIDEWGSLVAWSGVYTV